MSNLTPKNFLIALVMGVIWGIACGYFAKRKGKDPTGWFILGLLFNAFAFIVLALLPSKRAMQLAAEAKALEEQKNIQKELELKEAFSPTGTTLARRQWYYLDSSHSQIGPIDLEALKKDRDSGKISSNTFLWSEGMLDWKILDDLSYLKTELD